MYWKKTEINQLRDRAENKTTNTIEGLSRRIGVDSVSLREKFHEVREIDRISSMIV